ncbi:hypothetical protein V6N11_012451 [Hibiscus sabdariffa]|uniref:Uncharacterized protein n=1 Tax=Hibiscus sabdariffa TaxID=183260 RepID=A0ABR2QB66_9ROSI
MSNDDINTSYNPICLNHIFEDVDPLVEWLQEKDNPLLDGQNSGGDGQDSGGLSPTYDDGRESCDRGEIRSSRQHEEEYGIGFASGHFHHKLEIGGNMSATPSCSREKSEPRARSKEKGESTKMHTSEGSSSRRRSASTNPGYTDSSTSTHGFYPPGPRQSSYFQPPHGYYLPFPNYGMPMPYQPQMYSPPPMYPPPPPHMYTPQIYPSPQLFENQGFGFGFVPENGTLPMNFVTLPFGCDGQFESLRFTNITDAIRLSGAGRVMARDSRFGTIEENHERKSVANTCHLKNHHTLT